MNWVEWLIAIVTIMSPIIVTPLWYFRINSKWWYLTTSIFAYIITVYVSYNPFKIPGVTTWLHWYGLFYIFYMLLFGSKFQWTNWNKAAVISVYCLFIAGDLWEIPVFIYDYLGKIGMLQNEWTGTILNTAWLFSHIRRAYTLLSCYALSLIAGVKFTQIGFVYLIAQTIITFILLFPLAIGFHSLFPYLTDMARITALGFTGIIIWEGLNNS